MWRQQCFVSGRSAVSTAPCPAHPPSHPLPPSCSDAFERYEPERAACTLIQRCFRGWRLRLHLAEYHYYAREVQRVYRGHLGRKRCRRALDARESSARLAVRHYAATLIQSAFKGCYSRKYIHDFHERKRYVAAVVARGEALREELEAQFAQDLRSELERREAAARAAFKAATAGLHHLVSTAARPGVYNPPWATRRADVPSAFGVELEVHLRREVLATLRTRGLHGPSEALRAATAVAHGSAGAPSASVALLGHTSLTVVPAYASAASKATLQAAAPYDAPLLAARAQARASKYLNLDQRPVLAGTRGRHFGAPLPLGVHAAVPYQAPWLAARSDRETEHQRKAQAWVTGGVPFVAASARGGRLFEDSERQAAVKATGVLASLGATQAAPGASVRTIRVGERVLTAAAPTPVPVGVHGPPSPSPSSRAAPAQHPGRGGAAQAQAQAQSPPPAPTQLFAASAAAGSAVAAARAGRSSAASSSVAGSHGGGRFLAPSAGVGQEAPLGTTFLMAGGGIPAPLRKRPLMKPVTALQGAGGGASASTSAAELELAEVKLKATVAALSSSFTAAPPTTSKR